ELSRLLKGIDAVASAVGPCAEYEKTILNSCAACGIAAVTIGEGTIATEERQKIDDAFRAAGVPAVIGCGMMPGWTELLAAHILDTGGRLAHPEPPVPATRYLFFSPARFGGYAFLRWVAKGITGAAPVPAGAPAGNYFGLPDGSLIGVPQGKAGTRMGRIVGTLGKLGPVGIEFSAALLLWTRGGMREPAGTPVAVAGVAAGGRFARVEDPRGSLGAALLVETAVLLAARPRKATGLLPLTDLYGREEAEAIATAAGARIVTV
ncbi:MAG: hypothetical protein ACM3OG_08705, partial [Actinomycetota bacterium]